MAKTDQSKLVARETKAADVDAVNEPYVDPKSKVSGFRPEGDLSTEEVIQRRTPTINGLREWPADGRYRKVFTVDPPVVSVGEPPELDWNDDVHATMHEANKVAVLQDALNLGLHPRAEATFDGWHEDKGGLVYSVEVVPAASDERAADAYTPSKALVDQGGSTMPEFNEGTDKRD